MIAVLGSINIDLIASTDRLPERGETILGTSLLTAAGGKGANQALAARRAGANTIMVGAVGSDAFAEPALNNLNTVGVDLTRVRSVDNSTGTALIVVDRDGENMITVVGGANNTLTRDDAERAVAALADGDTLLMQLEIPASVVKHALLMARNRKVRTILNTAPAIAETAELVPLADVVIANENEFYEFSNTDRSANPSTTDDAANSQHLQQTVLNYSQANDQQILIVTRGGKGVVATHRSEYFDIAARAIDPVDTVGAGDTFCGYFARAYDDGQPLREALELGALAGSLTCLLAGAQVAIPTAEQVLAFANSN